MVVTCPYCNGIYCVKRTKYPTAEESAQKFIDGQKQGMPDIDITRFFCRDCNLFFNSEGRTREEINKWG